MYSECWPHATHKSAVVLYNLSIIPFSHYLDLTQVSCLSCLFNEIFLNLSSSQCSFLFYLSTVLNICNHPFIIDYVILYYSFSLTYVFNSSLQWPKIQYSRLKTKIIWDKTFIFCNMLYKFTYSLVFKKSHLITYKWCDLIFL